MLQRFRTLLQSTFGYATTKIDPDFVRLNTFNLINAIHDGNFEVAMASIKHADLTAEILNNPYSDFGHRPPSETLVDSYVRYSSDKNGPKFTIDQTKKILDEMIKKSGNVNSLVTPMTLDLLLTQDMYPDKERLLGYLFEKGLQRNPDELNGYQNALKGTNNVFRVPQRIFAYT